MAPDLKRRFDAESLLYFNTGLFNAEWRIAREQLRLQAATLGVLHSAANLASHNIPRGFPFRLDKLTPEDRTALYEWQERESSARGARDAFATGIILFLDNLLKGVLRFYRRIDGLPKQFSSGVNGISTDRIFRFTGNNVRHFDEWCAPTHEIARKDDAYEAVCAIATVVGRPVPKFEELSVMATNWAWPVIATVSGGTFEGLIVHVRAFLDELIANAGLQNDELVLAEVAKER
jgi:hypothetical protein